MVSVEFVAATLCPWLMIGDPFFLNVGFELEVMGLADELSEVREGFVKLGGGGRIK
jgi:hypothetical protein